MGKQNTKQRGLKARSEPPGTFTCYYSRPMHNTVSGLIVHSISPSTNGLVIPRIRRCSLAPERRLDGEAPDEKSSGHVPPPSAPECEVAIAPDRVIPAGQPGGIGFKFDRLGPRVPAIVISAYTPPQTRIHHIFEHTSILSTVVNCLGLPHGKLGARQAKALDLGDALTLSNPRQDRPPIAKPIFSIIEDVSAEWHSIIHSKLLGAKQKPISDLQRTALHAVALLTQADDLHNRIAEIENELEADLFLVEQEASLVKNKIL